jgi:hypothetical protein
MAVTPSGAAGTECGLRPWPVKGKPEVDRSITGGRKHETHFGSSMKSDLYLENYCAPPHLPSWEILARQGDNYQNRQVLQVLASPGCSGFAQGADLEMLAALAATRRDHRTSRVAVNLGQ